MTYTTNEVVLGGCDYAESDVYFFRKYKHFSNIGVSSSKEGFLMQIEYLRNEMNRRAKVLDRYNCRNVVNYNKKNDIKMPYIVFIVDELVQLTFDKKCKDELHMIMSKCRKYGIYFILGAQDATKDTIGRCKMNCPQVVGFRTFDETDSATLLGKDQNLQDIKGPGVCKIKNKNGITETKIMYIDEDEIESILKQHKR